MDDAPFIPLLFARHPVRCVKPYGRGAIVDADRLTSNPGDHFYETIQILKH